MNDDRRVEKASLSPARPTPARRLEPAERETALRRLPRWSDHGACIERTVRLTSHKAETLAKLVQSLADELCYPVIAVEVDDAVTFQLTSPQVEGVSDLDVAFAKRVDQLLLEVDTADLPASISDY